MYSKKTQQATEIITSRRARGPKNMTDAINAGISAIMTSSMMFFVFTGLEI
jgi:hypothetical protein